MRSAQERRDVEEAEADYSARCNIVATLLQAVWRSHRARKVQFSLAVMHERHTVDFARRQSRSLVSRKTRRTIGVLVGGKVVRNDIMLGAAKRLAFLQQRLRAAPW